MESIGICSFFSKSNHDKASLSLFAEFSEIGEHVYVNIRDL